MWLAPQSILSSPPQCPVLPAGAGGREVGGGDARSSQPRGGSGSSGCAGVRTGFCSCMLVGLYGPQSLCLDVELAAILHRFLSSQHFAMCLGSNSNGRWNLFLHSWIWPGDLLNFRTPCTLGSQYGNPASKQTQVRLLDDKMCGPGTYCHPSS